MKRKVLVLEDEESIRSFEAIVSGDCDHLPESAFFMAGNIDDVYAKAKKL